MKQGYRRSWWSIIMREPGRMNREGNEVIRSKSVYRMLVLFPHVHPILG
jgi:hypothetical protein